MTRDDAIIELGHWLATPAGEHLLAWERAYVEAAVSDAFGFHALQLGLPMFQGLRANRMPHRWVALGMVDQWSEATPGPGEGVGGQVTALRCSFEALPFPSASLDLVVMPHVLEMASDPHQTLREVERVLVPEGRVVITGFNSASLWGLRQRAGRAWRGLGLARREPTFLPRTGEFIGYWRLRDWMRLLSLDVESARFGAYRPPVQSQRWLERFEWMDRVGERWWPVLGAAYALSAVKHVRGMRLVGLAKQRVPRGTAVPAALAQRRARPAALAARRHEDRIETLP